ncbi:hypothetical protein [Methylobacterium terricola]|uniref:NrdR family transcriptional regulator n=1 Tax=Methylobacterium terricola TaxID=2583531 RepID=UPI003CCC57E2
MMICRHCQWPEVRVIDSRSTAETVKRRRRCTDCGYTWNTYEVPEGDYDALTAVYELLSSSALPLSGEVRRG